MRISEEIPNKKLGVVNNAMWRQAPSVRLLVFYH